MKTTSIAAGIKAVSDGCGGFDPTGLVGLLRSATAYTVADTTKPFVWSYDGLNQIVGLLIAKCLLEDSDHKAFGPVTLLFADDSCLKLEWPETKGTGVEIGTVFSYYNLTS
jgi:hypothetical protein